jgi:hypothetical protein
MMPDAKRKKGAGDGQEAKEAQANTDEVLSGVRVHGSTLNSYERARLCDVLARTFRDLHVRGSITVTLDGKVIR